MPFQSELKLNYVKNILSSPLVKAEEVDAYFKKIWDQSLISVQEQVYMLCLNDSNEVIGWRILNTGTSATTLFDIRLCVACALVCLAAKVIVAHNHPSGLLYPSNADMESTTRLFKALALIDIELLDHLIVNEIDFFSFKREKVHY